MKRRGTHDFAICRYRRKKALSFPLQISLQLGMQIVPEDSKNHDVAAGLLGIAVDALVCKPACKASQAPPRFRSNQKLGAGQGQSALAPYPPAKYINAVDNTDKLKCSWPPLGSGSFGTVVKVRTAVTGARPRLLLCPGTTGGSSVSAELIPWFVCLASFYEVASARAGDNNFCSQLGS
jgi:hypothetical protein